MNYSAQIMKITERLERATPPSRSNRAQAGDTPPASTPQPASHGTLGAQWINDEITKAENQNA